jgi:hypothetical protein
MVKPVDRIVPDFAKAGANLISFHPEASEHVDRTLALIKEHGCKAGLVLNPATPLDCLDHVIDKLDLVLIMSVNPGFGGQQFIPRRCQDARGARAHRRVRARGLAGGGRRREDRQHRRDRARRGRHLRRRVGDLRRRAAGCPVFCVPYGYNEGHDVRKLDVDAIVETLAAAARLVQKA